MHYSSSAFGPLCRPTAMRPLHLRRPMRVLLQGGKKKRRAGPGRPGSKRSEACDTIHHQQARTGDAGCPQREQNHRTCQPATTTLGSETILSHTFSGMVRRRSGRNLNVTVSRPS